MNTLRKTVRPSVCRFISIFVLAGAISARALASQALSGHVPSAVARLNPIEHLASSNRLQLTIGLPLRNRPALTNLLRQLYDPSSPQFRRYLSAAQFTDQFAPSAQDYAATMAFARRSGLAVIATHANRMLLDVEAPVAEVERTFQIKLQVYPHPTEARTFYAPNGEPKVELSTPLLHISGLDNYRTPRPMNLQESTSVQVLGAAPRYGSGPNGQYTGTDFRAAYVPGTTLTGAGQTLGLFELSGYYPTDITAYEAQTSLPAVPLQNVLIDGFSGSPGGSSTGNLNEEVALDIEMAISMAPGLSKIVVYEGSPSATTAIIDDILNRMATDNLAKQLSCSWGFDIDENSQQIFLEYAAQGQSFFLASGDTSAFSGVVTQPSDNPYLTVVGGTRLTTDGAHAYVAETTWSGSSGGISSVYAIPDWQQGIDMSLNQGSTSMRNTPDVAMVADNVLVVADQGQNVTLSGTSIAAPLWAGLTALVNQRAASQGKPPVGFLNPSLYTIGKGSGYPSAFHDITTGSNFSTNSPSLFSAVPGYDLCTGWGTPNGNNLIEALPQSSTAGLVVTPPLGVLSDGPVGGPFRMTSATYNLSDAGAGPLNWTAGSDVSWLQITPSSGSLSPGATATVSVSLSSNANALLIGVQTANATFTDLSTGNRQDRQFSLSIGNGGFETGDFTGWTFSGQADVNFADSVDASQWYGVTALQGVDDSQFVRSGIYGAFLGQTNWLGSLSQTLPTIAGQKYLLSFWLANPVIGTPNEFQVTWNGTTLFDQPDLGQFGWTNFQYVVTADTQSSTLQFGFRNDLNAFALDDISVRAVPAPFFQSVQATTDAIVLTLSAVPGVTYQVQCATDLNAALWTNLGAAVTATSDNLTVSDNSTGLPQRFYRIVETP